MHVRMYTNTYVCICVQYVCIYICMHMHVRMYTNTYVYVYVCMQCAYHAYVCVHIRVYISHIRMYTYTRVGSLRIMLPNTTCCASIYIVRPKPVAVAIHQCSLKIHSASVYAYIRTCIHICIHPYMDANVYIRIRAGSNCILRVGQPNSGASPPSLPPSLPHPRACSLSRARACARSPSPSPSRELSLSLARFLSHTLSQTWCLSFREAPTKPSRPWSRAAARCRVRVAGHPCVLRQQRWLRPRAMGPPLSSSAG